MGEKNSDHLLSLAVAWAIPGWALNLRDERGLKGRPRPDLVGEGWGVEC